MNSLALTAHQFRFAAIGALLTMAGLVNPVQASIITLGSGTELEATFTAVPNTADMLWFFDNVSLTVTGTPVISVELLNGSSPLGTYTQTSSSVIQAAFEATGSQYAATLFQGPAPTRVPFAAVNNGTIAGEMLLSVSGGTITFNTSDLVLYDGTSTANNAFRPGVDLRNIAYTPVPVPLPSTLSLLGLGLAALGFAWRRRAAAPA